ncbi:MULTISPECIES: cysteine hydrolase family protein [Pseudomonas]|uniref:cysteine hydrolase family protein n=1 Tax=Pseudomonas TaxID=286 RepID=UPI0010707416|nr:MULTISPECIES: isochorismatase family protein [Pseudomonas]QBR31397.1 isochorismatase family protein [Pseudomonas sp. S150]UZT94912.1 isochorismatase family protein [Pseudomonas koreensis]
MQNFTRRFLTACAFSGVMASTAAMADNHPTIRAMSGATPADHLPAGKSALVVIDFQNEYFSGRMPIPDGAAALAKTRELITFADSHKIPVYHVQHVAPAGSPVFAIDGQTVKFHPDMQPRPQDVVLQKSTVSVFASTDLDQQLKKAGIQTLIISGLMTHACVAGAARDAAPLGYNVIVASDASATRAITRANGVSIDKDSLHKAALAEVEDTFGDVLSTAQIVKLPVR